MTWSEGDARRDSERSKAGRGKVEAAVVVVVVDEGAAVELIADRRSPPIAVPELDAHDDAEMRAWRRAQSVILAGWCSRNARDELSLRSTPSRRRRSIVGEVEKRRRQRKGKNELVSFATFFLPLLPVLSDTTHERRKRKLISSPIVPVVCTTACSCPRRLESRRSVAARPPGRHPCR